MTMGGEENKSDSENEGGGRKKKKVLTRFDLPKESELRVECKLHRFFHVAVVPNSAADDSVQAGRCGKAFFLQKVAPCLLIACH